MLARRSAILGGLLALWGTPALALEIHGEYDSPLGRVRVEGDGAAFRGVLVAPAPACRFRAGEEVLRATLLDDSLAGEVRVCLAGKGCREKEAWSSAVLLAAGGKLSGAVHVAAKGCRGPLGKKGGVVFTKVGAAGNSTVTPTPNPTSTSTPNPTATPTPNPTATPTPTSTSTPTSTPTPTPTSTRKRTRTSTSTAVSSARRARARELLRDGATWLHEGNFEEARRRFVEAVEVDPGIPEAYNGVGVTFRMRGDLASALEWYKRALAVDPDFGDAYYNMACIYALEGRKDIALRYLQVALLNGYATAEGIDTDPDLEPLRGEPGYRALVRAKM